MSEAYHIYMKEEGSNNSYTDLESYFTGLKYSKCVGLNDKGKRKNVYMESYPEENGERVYMDSTVKRDSTDVSLTLFFTGTVASRQTAYENFCSFIQNKKILYYDSVRLREVCLVLTEPVKPSSEVFVGSEPYTEVTFKFKNIWGESRAHTNS